MRFFLAIFILLNIQIAVQSQERKFRNHRGCVRTSAFPAQCVIKAPCTQQYSVKRDKIELAVFRADNQVNVTIENVSNEVKFTTGWIQGDNPIDLRFDLTPAMNPGVVNKVVIRGLNYRPGEVYRPNPSHYSFQLYRNGQELSPRIDAYYPSYSNGHYWVAGSDGTWVFNIAIGN